MRKPDLYTEVPQPLSELITQAEWERLPPRAKLLISAGFVDVEEVMEEWRAHWAQQDNPPGDGGPARR